MSFNKQSLGELEQDKTDYENENPSRSELLTQTQGLMIYDLIRKPNNLFQNRWVPVSNSRVGARLGAHLAARKYKCS